MILKTLEECIEWIYEPRYFERRLDLARVEQALELFGSPIDYPCIHVGGTNGKGSVVTYLKSILLEAGYKVGTYISPFVVVFNERITLNHQYISDADVIRLTNHIKQILTIHHHPLSNFEILTIMSFLYFEEQQVDVAVVEVGLGGLLDATNVINKDVAVITNIGTDHAEILGNTKELIAIQKLGIVHDALITSVAEEMMPLFTKYISQRRAYMKHTLPVTNIQMTPSGSSFDYDGQRYDISMRGEHQTANAALAIETMQYLIQRKQYRVEQRHILQGLKKAFWPGRLEELTPGILIDGAHNVEGIQTLVDYLRTIDQPIHVIYACLEKKPYAAMVAMLEPVASKFTFTSFHDPGCLDPHVLFDMSTHPNKEVVNDITPYFMPEDGVLRIFCGSLYFISELRSQFFSK
jgi:dihydrofolate synthase / folylpolyglutamate synthase